MRSRAKIHVQSTRGIVCSRVVAIVDWVWIGALEDANCRMCLQRINNPDAGFHWHDGEKAAARLAQLDLKSKVKGVSIRRRA